MPTYNTSGDQTISAAPCCYCCPIDVTPCGPQFMYATVSASFCGVKVPYGIPNGKICLNPSSPCSGRHSVCEPENGYPVGPAQCLTSWPCGPDCNTCLGISGECETNWGIDRWYKCDGGPTNEDPIIPEYLGEFGNSNSGCFCPDSSSSTGYKYGCIGNLAVKFYQTCEESVAGTHYMLLGRGGANPKSGGLYCSGLTYCSWGVYYDDVFSANFNPTCQCGAGNGGNFGKHPGPVYTIWAESASGMNECERGLVICDEGGYYTCLIYPDPCPNPDFPFETEPPYCRYAKMIDGTILPAKWKPGYHSCGTFIGFGFDRMLVPPEDIWPILGITELPEECAGLTPGTTYYRTWGAVDVSVCLKYPCPFGTDPEFCPKPFTGGGYALSVGDWTDIPPNPFESFSLSGFEFYNPAVDAGLLELVRETCCINSMNITPGAILDDDGNPLGPGMMNC